MALGQSLVSKGDLSQAKTIYHKALQSIDPSDYTIESASIYYELGMIELLLNKNDQRAMNHFYAGCKILRHEAVGLDDPLKETKRLVLVNLLDALARVYAGQQR